MKRRQVGLPYLSPAVLFAWAVTAVLACAHAAPDPDSDHEQAIRQLERRITPGMSRREIENVLEEMDLHYLYVPRSMLEAMRQATFESTPLSGRIQVSLPEDKRIFYKTVGEVLIDLDEGERMVSLQLQRGNVPR
jgi:hypothetical protein